MRETHIIKETGSKEKGLYSIKKYGSGNIVLVLDGNYFPNPTRTSIQLTSEKHVESWEGGHVNHHCVPNTKVVVEQGEMHSIGYLIAIKNIEIGQEITFDYETTESVMAEPFKCRCHGNWIKGKDYDNYTIDQMMNEDGMDYSGAFESDVVEEYDTGTAAPITKDDSDRGSW